MRRHFEREIENLNKNLLRVGALVEEAIGQAMKALLDRRRESAEEVIRNDTEIDERELKIEEECLKILALYQPVASDLRFIVAIVKINNDLERMGDLAVNIAERAVTLADFPPLDIPAKLRRFSDHVRGMVKDALDALVNRNAGLALQVTRQDDDADEIHHRLSRRLKEEIANHPEMADRLLQLLSTSKDLERIADHATNIAEDVYYLVRGDIIRHHVGEFDKKAGFPDPHSG